MAVLVIDEDITLLDASDHDMLQDTDGIKAGKSWHTCNINTGQSKVKISTTSPRCPICVIEEDLSPLDATADDVMAGTGSVYAGLSRHDKKVATPLLH
ncbi:hypothetical protein M1B72_00990 [Geomonas paludis]|uniref:Uncharacterized protein n=1 Tax=Geomonas paludis TaxID=2740185 RepID=A0A6V8N3H5_9BACT|nr:hypothetical protein [Geomonas paludis]UPU38347.1 hypothetical protein M1B72_00990 [Geomonas paludis]GFO66417.1 hypothetical protein GMPD_43360 [Geomonas paludis]